MSDDNLVFDKTFIKLDILIDAEDLLVEFKSNEIILKEWESKSDLNNGSIEIIESFQNISKITVTEIKTSYLKLNKKIIELNEENLKQNKINNIELNKNNKEFYIILAKALRCHFSSLPEDTSEEFNQIAEELLREIPRPSEPGTQKYRLLFLLEISMCLMGNLSEGYAQLCLDLINNEKKTLCTDYHVYELVALYNKGIARAHVKRSQEAIDEYDEVIDCFKKDANIEKKEGFYYQTWSNDEENRKLWKQYTYIPCLFKKAEALQDLDRSGEAEYVLESEKYWEDLESLLNNKERLERERLKCYIKIDSDRLDEITEQTLNTFYKINYDSN